MPYVRLKDGSLYPNSPRQSLRKGRFYHFACVVVVIIIMVLIIYGRSGMMASRGYGAERPIHALTISKSNKTRAVVTNVLSEDHVGSALILGYTLQKNNPTITKNADLIVQLSRNCKIKQQSLVRLAQIGWEIHYDDETRINDANLAGQHRNGFMKLQLWRWTQYKKVVWLDADCMVLGDISLLLSENYHFGAVQDTDRSKVLRLDFHTAVLSLTPSLDLYGRLADQMRSYRIEHDKEKDLLNSVFINWLPDESGREQGRDWYYRARLPLKYNLNLEAYRSWREAWDQVWPDVRVVHYAVSKPDPFGFGGIDDDFRQPLEEWWKQWDELVARFGWTDVQKNH